MGDIVNKIAIYLNRHLTGNVFDKDSILEAYSTDRSLLKIKPRLVAIPENTADVRKLVRFVAQLAEKKYDLPIAVRGSGLCRTGADLTSGLVISMEKLDHIRELDPHDRLVHVQAGITLGKLNAALAPHGLVLPIAAEPNETIGSLIANATLDNYSKRYGGILNYADRAEVVLANGELVQTSQLSQGKLAAEKKLRSLEGEVHEKLDSLLIDNADLVESLPDTSRFSYSALKHVRTNNGRDFNLLPVFLGSEGTLGIITEVILRLEVLPPRPHRLLAVFPTFKAAHEFAQFAERLAPLSTELYDTAILKRVDESGKKPEILSRKFDDGYLVVVSFNDKTRKSRKKVKKCEQHLPKSAYFVAETLKNSSSFDALNACLSTYLNDVQKGERPSLLHDFYVPQDSLGEFIEELQALGKSHKKSLELYGCYSTGIYSIRPEFDLKKIEERRTALTLLRDFNDLLKRCNGNLAGGLPEGKIKSIILYPELGDEEKKLFESVKNIFDDAGILSPETKTTYDTRSTVKHLRTEPNQTIDS